MADTKRVFVTGATGYIGGRLVVRLLKEGYAVRVLSRDPARLKGRAWTNSVEVIEGDVLKPETLEAAMEGFFAAYYLIHSVAECANPYQRDLIAASNFGSAAKVSDIRRIICLSPLSDVRADRSRRSHYQQPVSQTLSQAGVPVTEFRSAIIVGSGSISFEMIRYLTERMPVLICPRWMFNRIQPIAVHNVIEYLVAALETPASTGKVIEIGGANLQTFGTMMSIYAKERNLKRLLIRVPVFAARLSSHWMHWVTPLNLRIAKPFVEGLQNDVIIHDDSARRLFPQIELIDYQTTVKRAISSLHSGQVETAWSDALTTSWCDKSTAVLSKNRDMKTARCETLVKASSAIVFRVFTALGGEQGWLYFNWAWRLRGLADRMLGGVGLRRGRRDPQNIRVGDAVDFWRVEAVEPDRLLRLRAEMKVPGKAWLQFEIHELNEGQTRLIQTAFFAPDGVVGIVYWYALYPIHILIFSGMIRKIGEQAETQVAAQSFDFSPEHPK